MACANRCGACAACIDGELLLLSDLEHECWKAADGNLDDYQFEMDMLWYWLNERGVL